MKFQLLILFLFSWTITVAQTTVTGTVRDASTGEALIGASVAIKGSALGAVTNIEGKYIIDVNNLNSDSLEFSYVGYERLTIAVKGRTTVDVSLKGTVMDEVVVVGYGEVLKSDLTGALSSVKQKNINELSINSADQLLQGRASGVFVNSSSGMPGGIVNIRIRGTNSLSANNEPLYVIDGIIIEYDGATGEIGSTSDVNTSTPTNPLSNLNPQDIANVEVLKDASATAIYGSKGANGVIIITTKQGSSGRPQVNFNSSIEITQVRKTIDVLNSEQYIRYRNEARQNDGGSAVYAIADSIDQAGGNLLNVVPTHNWQDELFRRAISGKYRLSVSGGDNKNKYFVAAGWQDAQGVVDASNWKKGDIRFNYTANLTDKLKLQSNLSLARTIADQTATNGAAGGLRSAVRSIVGYKPFFQSEATIDINEENQEDGYTPLAWIYDYKDEAVENSAMSKLALTYSFSKKLRFMLHGGLNYRNVERNKYWPRTTQQGDVSNGKASYSTYSNSNYLVEPLLFFNHRINKKNRLNGTVGGSYTRRDIKRFGMLTTDFPDDVLGFDNLALGASVLPPENSRTFEATLSALARVNYTFDNKFLLTFSGRYDGSSKFTDANKFAFFPSVAVAYRLSDEKFIQKIDAISNLKVRLSWGQTGSQALQPYQTLAAYRTTVQYPFGGNMQSGVLLSNIANENLKWETTSQANFGLDIGFGDGRITANIDLYQKNTKDLLQLFPMPTSSGFQAAWRNFGSLSNQGIELGLNTVALDKGGFRWNIGGNIAFNRNQITELGLQTSEYGYEQYWGGNIHSDGSLNAPANTFIVDQPVGLFWGYITDGIYQNETELNAGAEPLKQVGDIRFVDNNGDGVIDPLDKAIIGDPNPDFIWGLSTDLTYKNFSFSMLWNGVQGRDILNANLNTEEELRGGFRNIRTEAYEGRWTGEGTSNYYPRPHAYIFYNQVTDRLVEDASYVRLKNVSLGYTLPENIIKGIRSVRFFATGTNLLTITEYRGFDPEVDSFAWDGTRIGIDNNSYPSLKGFLLGFNITF